MAISLPSTKWTKTTSCSSYRRASNMPAWCTWTCSSTTAQAHPIITLNAGNVQCARFLFHRLLSLSYLYYPKGSKMDVGAKQPIGCPSTFVFAHSKSMLALHSLVLVWSCIHVLGLPISSLLPTSISHFVFSFHLDELGPPPPWVPDAPGRG